MPIRSGSRPRAYGPIPGGILLLLLAGCNGTLNMPAGPEAYRIMQAPPPEASREYRIGPGDQLSVNVYGQPDLSVATLIVDPAGEISLPLVGPVPAGGTTARELARAIEQKLGPRYLVNPRVAVNVTQYASSYVTVEGQVAQPGIVQVIGTTTLLTVLAQVRGPTQLARLDEVAVFRTIDGQRMAAKFDLRAIRAGQAPDPVILARDTVVVGFDRMESLWRDFLTTVPAFAVFSRPFY